MKLNKIDSRYDYQVIVEFKDGRKFVRQNLSKKKATYESNRYLKDKFSLGIDSVKIISK